MGARKSDRDWVKQGMLARQRAEFQERPPFPRSINVELSNVCNHACNFCAYSVMEREHGSIEVKRLERWLTEAYALGTREIGMHSGAEPFASRYLEHFVAHAKKVGYEYVYLSTNGSLATPKRMKAVIDAGIDSMKFSINAGDRETYKLVHGKDDFDKVIEHLRFAFGYRKSRTAPYIAISFVVTDQNAHTVEAARAIAAEFADEFIDIRASNQSGQMTSDSGAMARKDEYVCPVPFNKLHISWEGFLRGCCNDYENLLALEDLNEMSLEEAYYGERARKWRLQHLENRVEGTLCYNCKHDTKTPVQPLNADLYFRSHATDKGPKVSYSPIILRNRTAKT